MRRRVAARRSFQPVTADIFVIFSWVFYLKYHSREESRIDLRDHIESLFCLIVLCRALLVLRKLFLKVISVILHSVVYEAEITLIE